jgi:hypothetical protein
LATTPRTQGLDGHRFPGLQVRTPVDVAHSTATEQVSRRISDLEAIPDELP